MIPVYSLQYGVIFKKVFSNVEVFNAFCKDVIGKEVEVSKVDQEYEYNRPIGAVRSKYDLFAEDEKNRVIVEIQHVCEDSFFDRFLYYHCLAIVEQLQKSTDYTIERDVYTIVVRTSPPHKKEEKFSMAVCCWDPIIKDGDQYGKHVPNIYRHQIIFLNPRLVNDTTPPEIRPWLSLIKESLGSQINEETYPQHILKKVLQIVKKENTLTPEEKANLMAEAEWQKVREKERQEGQQEERIRNARNAIKIGLNLEIVQSITGLSKEELQKIMPED